jgi:hypothetical protein
VSQCLLLCNFLSPTLIYDSLRQRLLSLPYPCNLLEVFESHICWSLLIVTTVSFPSVFWAYRCSYATRLSVLYQLSSSTNCVSLYYWRQFTYNIVYIHIYVYIYVYIYIYIYMHTHTHIRMHIMCAYMQIIRKTVNIRISSRTVLSMQHFLLESACALAIACCCVQLW